MPYMIAVSLEMSDEPEKKLFVFMILVLLINNAILRLNHITRYQYCT